MNILLVQNLFMLTCLFKLSRSFSYMVPQDSCYSMNPAHNSSQQSTSSPFKIYVGSSFYQHDDEIKGKKLKRKFN